MSDNTVTLDPVKALETKINDLETKLVQATTVAEARLDVLEKEYGPEVKLIMTQFDERLGGIEAKIGPEASAWFDKIEAFSVKVEEKLRALRFW